MNAVRVRKLGAAVWQWEARVWIDSDAARPLPITYSGTAATRRAAARRGRRFVQQWERRHDESEWEAVAP